MSIEQQILSLERLAAADAEIKELTEGIEKERSQLDGIRKELSELEERLEADNLRIAEMEKTRGDLVQELRQISGQIDRSRERLQRARNEREVNAAERELDELRKIQRDRDDEIKKLVELSEQARGSLRQSEERKAELSGRLAGSVEGSTKTMEELEQKRAAVAASRAEIAKELPSLVFRRYERVLSRGRVPIAKTSDGTCQGCFVQLPPMMFHQMLSRLAFEECPNCHRIIYYAPPPTEEELAAKAAAESASADAESQEDSPPVDAST